MLASYTIFLEKERRFSQRTVVSYVSDIKSFFLFFTPEKDDVVFALSQTQIQSFFLARKNDGIALSSISRCLSSLKSFFRYTKKKFGKTNDNIFKIKSIKFKQSLPRPIEENVFPRLVSVLRSQARTEWEGMRDEALAYLIYSTGMRISEALSLTHQHFGRSAGEITITGKGNKQRIIVIHKMVLESVSKYIKVIPRDVTTEFVTKHRIRPHEIPIFLSKTGRKFTPRMFQYILATARNSMGLHSSFTPHALRHSFASHILNNGGDIKIIKDILGHTSLKTTQRYLKISDNALDKAYKRFHKDA